MSNDQATKMTDKQAVTFSANGHKRAVLYARVSSDDSKKDGRNLQSQLEMGRKYATEKDYRIVAELPEDDKGASGASFDLPQLGAILAMAERHEFDVLVVRELDRLSRNLAKQLIVEESLKRNDVTVEYVLADYADSPEGNLQKHIRATVAEYEREKIKERMTRGRRNVVKSGRIMLHGDKPPYGYRAVIEKRDDKDVVTGLKVYEPEARIIRLIFDWYTLGDENGNRLSAYRIAQRLTEKHIPTWGDIHGGTSKKTGRGEWQDTTVSYILTCETYKGKWYYGRQNGKTGVKSQRDTWIPLDVPAIIEPAQWDAAQKIRQQNVKTSPRNVKHKYLMRYRVKGTCGYSLAAAAQKIRGRTYAYYAGRGRCKVSQKCGKCGLYFRADHVDALVWDWLAEWFKDPADLRRKLEAYKAEQDKINAPVLALVRTNESLIADNQAQLDRLLDLYLSGTFDKAMLTDRKARLETTIADLASELADLQARLAGNLSNDDIENLIEFAYLIADGIAEASESFEKRRQIVDVLDVKCILGIEGKEKVCYASFILTEGAAKRLVLPKRTRTAVFADCKDHSSLWATQSTNSGAVISARLVLPKRTRTNKPQVDIGALFAKVGAEVLQ